MKMAADAGSDSSCPSPEIGDSRKRPLESDNENGTTKRSHFSTTTAAGGDATYHFKTLVPAVAAGAIIGKGGETIAALQKETNTRVKMSKSHDFYPGTTERVCLISGSTEAIMNVLDFIMDKIREKPDLTLKLTDTEQKQAQERDKQVKILVPNSTAGMIIGKAGGYIKQIKEESGSYVQISQKPKDITLQERCITVIGEKENNKVACKMILQKIAEDPQSGILLNVSYADVSGPVANYNPIGSPYAISQPNSLTVSSSTSSLNSALSSVGTGASLLVNGTIINLSLNLSSPNNTPTNITQPIVENLKMTMRRYGHTEAAANEVSVALTLLAKYGVNITGSHSNGTLPASSLSYLNLSSVDQSTAAAVAAATTNSSVFGAIGQGAIGQVSWDSINGATSPSLHTSIERARWT